MRIFNILSYGFCFNHKWQQTAVAKDGLLKYRCEACGKEMTRTQWQSLQILLPEQFASNTPDQDKH